MPATSSSTTGTTTTGAKRDRDIRKYKITTLKADGSNFGAWKHRVQRALGINGLWKIVQGTEPRPAAGDPSLNDWTLHDEEAMAQIEFTIKDDPLQTILDTSGAKDAWDRLCDRYEGKGKKRLVRLIDKVFHTAFSDSEPLESQINDLLANIRKINELKANTFDDEIMAIAIINALPASLDMLQTILAEFLGNATALVSTDVKSQIIEDEQRCIGRSGSDATAFFAKARGNACKGKQPKHKTDQGDKPKGKLHCSHCDIAGHDITECRKLKREKAKANNATPKASDGAPKETSKASAKVAVVNDDTDDSSDFSDSSAQPPPKLRILRATHCALTDEELEHAWIVDSGASRTMTPNRSWFTQFSPLSTPIVIALGDNSVIRGIGVGRVTVELQVHGTWQPAVLQDVLYVPELHGNLLSVAQLTRHGYDVCFSKDNCKLLDSASTVACVGTRYANLYTLPIRINPPDSARVATAQVDSFPSEGEDAPVVHALTERGTSKADVNTWHRRLAHLDHDAMMRMVRRGMVCGMEIVSGSSQPTPCKPCLKGKQTRSEILKHTETRSDTVLGRIFSDVCGKLPTRSHVGYEYFATFVDDKS